MEERIKGRGWREGFKEGGGEGVGERILERGRWWGVGSRGDGGKFISNEWGGRDVEERQNEILGNVRVTVNGLKRDSLERRKVKTGVEYEEED